jgi:hypothetical protein
MASSPNVEHETVTIGDGHGQIVEVTADSILYRGEDGADFEVSLARYVERRPCYVG